MFPRIGQLVLYHFIGLFLRVFFGLRHVNRPELDGPFILAPNHTSFMDPMVLQAVVPRHITFLMEETIYENRLLRWFFRYWGAIPIATDGAVTAGALKSALAATRAGGLVGIFPEGRISLDGGLQPGLPGVGLLMQRARVPVIPVAILGTHDVLPRHARFPRPGRILIAFGDPIPPVPSATDRKQAATQLRDRVMLEIARLQRASARRV